VPEKTIAGLLQIREVRETSEKYASVREDLEMSGKLYRFQGNVGKNILFVNDGIKCAEYGENCLK